jgi:hypothetical protein
MAGILSAMFLPHLARLVLGHSIGNPLYLFPIIFGCSILGCLLGTLLNPPEDEAVLKNFYRTVNPWGAWGPIRAKVMAEDPGFVPNPNFKKDMSNVLVGIVWQLCLTALPIYIVLRNWNWVAGILVLLVATTAFIKFNWFDKLENSPSKIHGKNIIPTKSATIAAATSETP